MSRPNPDHDKHAKALFEMQLHQFFGGAGDCCCCLQLMATLKLCSSCCSHTWLPAHTLSPRALMVMTDGKTTVDANERISASLGRLGMIVGEVGAWCRRG